jgi:hypothetical protein
MARNKEDAMHMMSCLMVDAEHDLPRQYDLAGHARDDGKVLPNIRDIDDDISAAPVRHWSMQRCRKRRCGLPAMAQGVSYGGWRRHAFRALSTIQPVERTPQFDPHGSNIEATASSACRQVDTGLPKSRG